MSPQQWEQSCGMMRDACTSGSFCTRHLLQQHPPPSPPTTNVMEPGCPDMWHPRRGLLEAPSGLLPSERKRPVGSRWQGTLADSNAHLMMSFIEAYLEWCPLLKLQLRPCVLWTLTSTSQLIQGWGRQRGIPSRRPAAILTTSSLLCRPKEATGRALSHVPVSEQETAMRRAFVLWSWACPNRVLYVATTRATSQTRCWNESGGDDGGSEWPSLQREIADSILGSRRATEGGIICCTTIVVVVVVVVIIIITVEPPNRGHFGTAAFVLSSEVVLFSQVLKYLLCIPP